MKCKDKITLMDIVAGKFSGSAREKQRVLYQAYRALLPCGYQSYDVTECEIYETETLEDLGLKLGCGVDKLARRKTGTMLTARAAYEDGPGDPVFAYADTGEVMSFAEYYKRFL